MPVIADTSFIDNRPPNVAAQFLEADARFRELGYPYFLALTQLDHAAWLVAQDRPADAEPLLTPAAATFDRLGARPRLFLAQDLLSAMPHVAVELATQS